jgi:hypothetical protein
VAVLLSLISLPVAAQQLDDGRKEIDITGQVVDRVAGEPVQNARVELAEPRRMAVTDEHGRFRMKDVPFGPRRITVERLGYEQATLNRTIDANTSAIEIEITPKPVELEGIQVMSDRLERRRRSAVTSVWAYDAEDINASPAFDAHDFVRQRVFTTPCPRFFMGTTCVIRRGRVISPRVFIDEAPMFAGMDFLVGLNTEDVYLVEIYGNGEQIRVYTNWFARRLANGQARLQPVILF